MLTSDFDYPLPPELIAQTPAEPRDSSRLLVVPAGARALAHHAFRDLPELLRPGDLLVVNDTRVMAARLHGQRAETGGKAEALLVRETAPGQWETLFRPARAAVPGRRFTFVVGGEPTGATVVGRDGNAVELAFDRTFDPATAGDLPLPPYIRDYHGDPERYQTVYGQMPGSAAAPTAGLHFTGDVLARLTNRGIERVAITLDVGPGTFVPVTASDPRQHAMHAEHVSVGPEAARAIATARAEGRRVVAVGTTVVRTLEHVARERGGIEPYDGWTSLLILPGDPFLAVDVLLTNFHLPQSTLLMLVCAFAGYERVMAAYREAVAQRYRFYSFGDAMLLERGGGMALG